MPLTCVMMQTGRQLCACIVGTPGCNCGAIDNSCTSGTCDMKTMKCPPAAKTSAKKADEGFFEKDHFGLVWWIWAAIIGGVLVLIIAGITIACIVRRAKRDTDWGSAVQASAYNNSVMAPSDPSPDLFWQSESLGPSATAALPAPLDGFGNDTPLGYGEQASWGEQSSFAPPPPPFGAPAPMSNRSLPPDPSFSTGGAPPPPPSFGY